MKPGFLSCVRSYDPSKVLSCGGTQTHRLVDLHWAAQSSAVPGLWSCLLSRDLFMRLPPWRDSILHMSAPSGSKRHVFVRCGFILTMLKVGRLIWPEILNQLWIANNILRPFMYAPTSLLLRNYDAEHNRLHIRIT